MSWLLISTIMNVMKHWISPTYTSKSSTTLVAIIDINVPMLLESFYQMILNLSKYVESLIVVTLIDINFTNDKWSFYQMIVNLNKYVESLIVVTFIDINFTNDKWSFYLDHICHLDTSILFFLCPSYQTLQGFQYLMS
jgi:hypothetical protein